MLKVHVKTGLSSLRAQKLRTLLAMLGVLIGTASFVTLISCGQLATQHALDQFRALGTNLLALTITPDSSASSRSGQSNQITLSDMSLLKAASPNILTIAPYVNEFYPVSYNGQLIPAQVIGLTEALGSIVKISMAQGRFVSDLDKQGYFCVLGYNVAKALREKGLFNPLGKQIELGSQYFEIIGVARHWPENIFLFTDINHSIMVPITQIENLQSKVNIQNILFRIREGTSIDATQNAIIGRMNLLVNNPRLFFRSPKEIIARMSRQQATLTELLGLIGSIALLVGGIGIMNIMLVSVMERKQEIGIRLAIGARSRDIQLMFLLESVALTVLGGIIGVLLGVGSSFVIARLAGWVFYLFVFPIFLGFLVSVLVGIFFGFYPALKASRLNPIDALRTS